MKRNMIYPRKGQVAYATYYITHTESPLLTRFFETLEKQQSKQKAVLLLNVTKWNGTKWKFESIPCYLENRVSEGLPVILRMWCTLGS